jgi:hypothetical protein
MNLLERFAHHGTMIWDVWVLWVASAAWLTYGSLQQRRTADTGHSLRYAWVLLLLPIAVLFWGALAYRWDAPVWGRPSRDWPYWVLSGLALLELVLAVVLSYRSRTALKFVVPAALVGLGITALAWAIGAMSISGDWI